LLLSSIFQLSFPDTLPVHLGQDSQPTNFGQQSLIRPPEAEQAFNYFVQHFISKIVLNKYFVNLLLDSLGALALTYNPLLACKAIREKIVERSDIPPRRGLSGIFYWREFYPAQLDIRFLILNRV
jgi:hypothetical protein